VRRKIPPDAFDYYFALGVDRSYQAVAEQYGVSKQAVTRAARKEQWQERLARIEEKAQRASTKQAVESLEEMTQRHLQTLKVLQSKALQTLKSMPLTGAMDAVRTLDMCIAKERLIRGEPSDRTAVSIEETIRNEYQRWMGPQDNGNPGKEGDRAGHDEHR
jgi:predicted DNA-binding protein YlxM (UPF0122 family)